MYCWIQKRLIKIRWKWNVLFAVVFIHLFCSIFSKRYYPWNPNMQYKHSFSGFKHYNKMLLIGKPQLDLPPENQCVYRHNTIVNILWSYTKIHTEWDYRIILYIKYERIWNMCQKDTIHIFYDMILLNENNQNFTACEALFWINLHQTR